MKRLVLVLKFNLLLEKEVQMNSATIFPWFDLINVACPHQSAYIKGFHAFTTFVRQDPAVFHLWL